MVVAAHVGDLIWRCGGTIAKYTHSGIAVKVIILSYGLRGESAALWKDASRTWKDAKRIRHAEAEAILFALGVSDSEFWDIQDYPLATNTDLTEHLASSIREFTPTILLTHDRNRDVMNQDHGLAAELVWQASILAGATGFQDGWTPVSITRVFGFEPHMPDMSNFTPDIYIDITDVWDIKQRAMSCNETQKGIIENYVAKAKMRANHFRRMGGRKSCEYAECFSSFYPAFVDWLY